MPLPRLTLVAVAVAVSVPIGAHRAEQPPAAPAWASVRPIEPPATPLPDEAASARVTRFAFAAYGDTRSSGSATEPGDGDIVQPEHSRLVDRLIARVREAASTPFPVRFVLQSGDAVLRGPNAAMWNVSFTPIIERLTRGANVPYFFSVGNHDVTSMPAGDPGRALGLHNTLTVMSKLLPPEGSARRLSGYPTYAFGFGNAFFIAFDSDIAADPVQLAWVTDQLEHLDRSRYRHIVAFFHHPVFSSGPHSGASAEPVPGTGQKAPDRVEPQTTALRALYMPLFRKHQVRMLITGHDHLFDHWVERYASGGATYRMDCVVTGGGGAPKYGYAGEPDLRAYLAANQVEHVQVEHLAKPGPAAENAHHFVIVQVDGDRLSLEVVGTDTDNYRPYPGQRSTMALSDHSS
ncbi:MAG TPA: metallophosphoesterase [Vicinamibacterales bacterium]|nr:metallophosphoesterase [Vicinamibacterales bacterium]